MRDDNIKKYKKKLVSVFLSNTEPLTYDEISDEMEDFSVPENFLKKMLRSLKQNNMLSEEIVNGEKAYSLTHFGRRRFSVIQKRNKIQARRRKVKTATAVVCLIAVFAVLAWCIFFTGQGGQGNIAGSDNAVSGENSVSYDIVKGYLVRGLSSSASFGDNMSFDTAEFSEADISDGSLIVVNNSHSYERVPDGLSNIADKGSDSFFVSSQSLTIRSEVIDMLNNMLDAYNEETGNKDILVSSAYRSVSDQQAIYDDSVSRNGSEYADKNAAKGGHSDSQSGYALSFSRYSDGETSPLTGTDSEKWLEENAYKYGFIQRYPEGKEDYTGFEYRAANYRYVGIVHAAYIKEQGLCLEEYEELLKNKYSYGSDVLRITVPDGEFGVYYVAGTSVPVPVNAEFTVSGNNSDGFIVTYLIRGV